MSEFSDSFHLLASFDDAVAFVRQLGTPGVVLPEGDRWTCVVLRSREEPGDLARSWRGLLAHFENAPDHECRVRLFERGAKVGEIRILFEGQKPKPFEPAPWIERGLLDARGAATVARWVAQGESGPPSRRVGHQLAELLGFRHYRWLSADHLADRFDEIRAREPDAIAIGMPELEEEPVQAVAPPASKGPTLTEVLVEDRLVTLAPGHDASDLEAGVDAILRKHGGAAKRARALIRWLATQSAVRRVDVDEAVLEGILEAF